MIRKYHNHKLQTTPWHREEEPLNHHETPGRQIKQSNQLSLPHQDVYPCIIPYDDIQILDLKNNVLLDMQFLGMDKF